MPCPCFDLLKDRRPGISTSGALMEATSRLIQLQTPSEAWCLSVGLKNTQGDLNTALDSIRWMTFYIHLCNFKWFLSKKQQRFKRNCVCDDLLLFGLVFFPLLLFRTQLWCTYCATRQFIRTLTLITEWWDDPMCFSPILYFRLINQDYYYYIKITSDVILYWRQKSRWFSLAGLQYVITPLDKPLYETEWPI